MNDNVSKQISVYSKKYFRIFWMNMGWIKILMAVGITWLVVQVAGEKMFIQYSATRNGAFALVCVCIWTGLFNSIETICSERRIIRQEHSSGIAYRTFLLAHLNTDLSISLLESVVITIVVAVHFLTRIQVRGTLNLPLIISLFITFFLIVMASDAMGLMISAIVTSPKWSMTVMPFVLILQFIVSGFIFELKGAFAWIANLTIAKWGIQAVCIALDVNALTTDLENTDGMSTEVAEIINRYASQVKLEHIKDYTTEGMHRVIVLIILLLFIIVQTVIAIWSMKLIDLDKR